MGGRLTVSVGAGVSDAEFRIGAAALVIWPIVRCMRRRSTDGTRHACEPCEWPELVGGANNAPGRLEVRQDLRTEALIRLGKAMNDQSVVSTIRLRNTITWSSRIGMRQSSGRRTS